MIVTARPIKICQHTSDNVFEDLMLPLSARQGFTPGKSPVIPVYAYRHIGIKQDSLEYCDLLQSLDIKLSGLGDLYLKFTKPLPILSRNEIADKTQPIWEHLSPGNNSTSDLTSLLQKAGVFPRFNSDTQNLTLEKTFSNIVSLYQKNTMNLNATLLKNFCLKILHWIQEYTPSLFQDFNINNIQPQTIYNPKVLFYGDIKEHEVYFLILLSKLGADVLYLNTLCDMKFRDIDSYFSLCKLPVTGPLPGFPQTQVKTKEQTPVTRPLIPVEAIPSAFKDLPETVERRERNFEELARLSTSTVMIRAYNQNSEILGTGSGVIIDKNGLIVTNYHVIESALYLGVVFEGMDEKCQYETYTIINASIQRDLALIKIHLKTNPVEIDRYSDVVRGQRVVAIGSPLGLMNTFSDGIISGFRRSDKYDFIQTTAPMSPGSSGGALLNMYGELIGVTSAGYIDGQNLNLAVPVKYIIELLEQKFTLFNMEIMNQYYSFRFDNIKIEFDGFFHYNSEDQTYKVALYQCRHDRANLPTLIQNKGFTAALENYFMESISSMSARHGIEKYDFELGAQNDLFYYSYCRGRITGKGWKRIKDES